MAVKSKSKIDKASNTVVTDATEGTADIKVNEEENQQLDDLVSESISSETKQSTTPSSSEQIDAEASPSSEELDDKPDTEASTSLTEVSLSLEELDSDLYSKATEFITSELSKVELEDGDYENLASDLIESDLNLILSVKEEYDSELFTKLKPEQVLEFKCDKVNKILETIKAQDKDKLLDTDKCILELALESRLFRKKADKKKELVSHFMKLFSGKLRKTNIESARTKLRDTYKSTYGDDKYKTLEETITKARSDMLTYHADLKYQKNLSKVRKLLEQIYEGAEDEAKITDIRVELEQIISDRKKQIDDKKT